MFRKKYWKTLPSVFIFNVCSWLFYGVRRRNRQMTSCRQTEISMSQDWLNLMQILQCTLVAFMFSYYFYFKFNSIIESCRIIDFVNSYVVFCIPIVMNWLISYLCLILKPFCYFNCNPLLFSHLNFNCQRTFYYGPKCKSFFAFYVLKCVSAKLLNYISVCFTNTSLCLSIFNM